MRSNLSWRLSSEPKPIQSDEMVRAIRDGIHKETEDLSREDLKAYFAHQTSAWRREVMESRPDERRPGRPAS